tara:strand:+ start:1195 stop:1872 length:678 start_codon:yes stop_codon:yes gene_type:complete
MTIAEMHIEFKVGLDKTDSLNYPNFEPEEIDLWLNKAQDKFVKQRYSHDVRDETFEETQKRTDDLRETIIQTMIEPTAPTGAEKPDGVLFELPQDYWFAINEECEIRYMDCNGSLVTDRVGVKVIQHDDYNKIIKDPFNKPDRNQIVRLMHQNFSELISDGSLSIDKYFLRYLKEPITMSLSEGIDCELANHTHTEIVTMAVGMALENTANPRFQTHMVEQMSQE